MFFIVIIAALLYVYRWFRKTGAAVASRFVDAGPAAPSQRLSGPLEQRLAAMDASRTALWDGERRISNGELLGFLQRVARAATADGVERGVPVVLEQDQDAPPLAVAVAALAGVHFAETGRAVTGTQLRRWLEQEPPADAAVGAADASEAAELEAGLEGLVLSGRDSVRHRPAAGRAGRRVLRWQAGGGGGAVGMLGGRAPPAAAEASVLLLGAAELKSGTAAVQAFLAEGGWLRRWALRQALSAAALPATLWARAVLQTTLVVADTLFFPAAVAAAFGPRAAHLLVAREEGPVDPATVALLRVFGLQIHLV